MKLEEDLKEKTTTIANLKANLKMVTEEKNVKEENLVHQNKFKWRIENC